MRGHEDAEHEPHPVTAGGPHPAPLKRDEDAERGDPGGEATQREGAAPDLRSNPDNRIGTGAGSGQPRDAEEVAEQIAGRPS